MRDPLGLFLGSIASPETRRQYRSKLDLFLTGIGMQGSLEDKARLFVERGKKDIDWAFDMAFRFMAYQKMRCSPLLSDWGRNQSVPSNSRILKNIV
ncbi:hypothetical protein [Nitrososphaera sp.]|uniref:hypothetical protein n=1 Tax=Nitrososphaera sp. TaxID=1971748 RepID=UPI002EDAC68C